MIYNYVDELLIKTFQKKILFFFDFFVSDLKCDRPII